MKKLSVSYIDFLLAKFEKLAIRSIKMKSFNRAIRLLNALSYVRYKFHLGYKDEFIESQIKELAKHIKNAAFIENKDEKAIVIIDEINADRIGLISQYLAAFIKGSYKILYLYEHKVHKYAVRSHLMQMLNTYENAQLKEIPSNMKGLSISQWIYDEVCAFGSKKIVTNIGQWGIEKLVPCYALSKDCKKYRINAGDHCFWPGVSCADYTFELRHYGANLTHKERGLNKDQIIYLPFYPVMEEVPFLGFPERCIGKFVFFSGGAAYKIVDETNTFFRLCKKILDRCPDAIFLFAGDNPSSVVTNSINEFALQDRFVYLGYRNDILEVFRHIDVFIDTFPIGGGTMCQFAAQCSKPIVNYLYPGVEECVAQKSECKFTYYTEEDFIEEAVKLYNDSEYRKNRGKIVNDAVVSKDEFDEALISFVSTGKRMFEVKWDESYVPRKLSTEDAIQYNNKSLFVFYYLLFKILGLDSIWIMPGNFFSFGIIGIKRKLGKIIKK